MTMQTLDATLKTMTPEAGLALLRRLLEEKTAEKKAAQPSISKTGNKYKFTIKATDKGGVVINGSRNPKFALFFFAEEAQELFDATKTDHAAILAFVANGLKTGTLKAKPAKTEEKTDSNVPNIPKQ